MSFFNERPIRRTYKNGHFPLLLEENCDGQRNGNPEWQGQPLR